MRLVHVNEFHVKRPTSTLDPFAEYGSLVDRNYFVNSQRESVPDRICLAHTLIPLPWIGSLIGQILQLTFHVATDFVGCFGQSLADFIRIQQLAYWSKDDQ